MPCVLHTDDRLQKFLPNSRNDVLMNSVIPSTTAPVPTPAANWYVEPVLNTPLPDLEHYYQADRLASFDDAIIQVEFANNHQPMPAGPEHWEEQRKEWLKHSKHVHPVDEQVISCCFVFYANTN